MLMFLFFLGRWLKSLTLGDDGLRRSVKGKKEEKKNKEGDGKKIEFC